MEYSFHGNKMQYFQLVVLIAILSSLPSHTATGPSCPEVGMDIQAVPQREDYQYPDNVSLTCQNVSLALIGPSSVHCSRDGQWKPPLPVCQAITCPVPQKPVHGQVYLENLNGSVKAHFSCDVGHVLIGLPMITCSHGSGWLDEYPTCLVNCSTPSPPDYGFNLPNSCTHLNCTAHFSCVDGYHLIDNDTTSCEETGNWTSNASRCEPVNCRVLVIANGSLRPESAGYTYNSTLTITCDDGFVLRGSSTLTCNALGLWKGNIPTCLRENTTSTRAPATTELNTTTAVLTTPPTTPPTTSTTRAALPSCPAPRPLKHGRHQTVSGAKVRYSCDHGYQLDGDSELVCVNGSWVGVPPLCVVVRTTTVLPTRQGVWQQVFIDHARWAGVYKFGRHTYSYHFNVNSVPIDNGGGVIGRLFEGHDSKFELEGMKVGEDVLFKMKKIIKANSRIKTKDWYMRGRLHKELCSWKYEGKIEASGFGSFTMESYIDDMRHDPRCSPHRQTTLVIVGICVAIAIVIAIAAVAYYCIRRKGGIRSSGHRTLTSFENPVYEYENSLK